MARKIEFNTTCKDGTPDTRRSGRNTRKARSAFTSKPPRKFCSIVEIRLERGEESSTVALGCHYSPYDDYTKIQEIPSVPHVRTLMHEQSVRDNLHGRLGSENDEKDDLDALQVAVRHV